MSDPGTTRVVFRGPAALAGMVAQILREQGLEVSYEPPMESRGIGSDMVPVIFYIGDKLLDATVGISVESAIRAGVTKVKARHPSADIEIDEDI